MKEAFWGILIVMLGLVGIVIVNIFQNVTIGNDRTYYQLKESAEAAAYDAIDLTYYRLNGDIRMVEDKFVENFTRRFAQNIGNNGNFNITVQVITGNPPRISIKVATGITSLQGDDFGIVNRIDGIIETKYKIGEITNFLGITEEEWLARTNENNAEDNACNITTYGSEELECMPGDLEFTSWGSEGIPETVCSIGTSTEEKRDANYRICECGKWKEESEEVTTTPIKTGSEYVYNWYFHKDGEIRDIDEKTKTRAYVEKCTTKIEIYVPKDLRIKEPSADNSAYEICPASGTTVNINKTIALHANYIPSDSSNRDIEWSKPKTDNTITLQSSNPLTDKGYSKAYVTGKELGTTTVTATSTNGLTATCKVTVLDGNVDTVGCNDITLTVGTLPYTMESTFTPYTADKTNFTWVSSDTNIGTINKDTGEVKPIKEGTSTITVTAPNGKTGTCKLTVKSSESCKLASLVGTYWQHYQVVNGDGTVVTKVCLEYSDKKKDIPLSEIKEYTTESGIWRDLVYIDNYRDCTMQYVVKTSSYSSTCSRTYYSGGVIYTDTYKCTKYYSQKVYDVPVKYTCTTKIIYEKPTEVVDKLCIKWSGTGGTGTSEVTGDSRKNYVDGYSCKGGTVSKIIDGKDYCCS